MFSIKPFTGWADSYGFIESDKNLIVIHNDLGSFQYDSEGNFLDAEKYIFSKLNSSEISLVLSGAEEILSYSGLENEQRANHALNAILRISSSNKWDEYRSYEATFFKIKGLAYEALGKNEEAIFSFEKALEINPKIGVKRKINNIKKLIK